MSTGWHDIRRSIQSVTHATFAEPGAFTAPGSDEPRKDADEGPWAVDDFPEQGRLVLDSGSSYVVMTRNQTDTLITLGLAAEE